MEFQYEINKQHPVPVVYLKGRLLNNDEAEQLLQKVDETIMQSVTIIIDLSGLEYMNSTGLGLLIKILTKARNAGGEVIISSVPETIKQLLMITKINSVFNVAQTLEDALQIIETINKSTSHCQD